MGALSIMRSGAKIEPTAEGDLHCQDEQRLAYRGKSLPFTLPLL
jgi:hypothetical protein